MVKKFIKNDLIPFYWTLLQNQYTCIFYWFLLMFWRLWVLYDIFTYENLLFHTEQYHFNFDDSVHNNNKFQSFLIIRIKISILVHYLKLNKIENWWKSKIFFWERVWQQHLLSTQYHFWPLNAVSSLFII